MAGKTEKKKFVSWPVYSLILLVAGVSAGAACYLSTGNSDLSLLCGGCVALIIPILSLAFCFIYLPIMVHELGHYLAGRLLGFSFFGVRIGPFQCDKVENGLKWSRVRSNLGGAVLIAPNGNHDLLRRMQLTILAGPMASALWFGLLALFLGILGVSWNQFWHPSMLPPSKSALDAFALYSGLIFVLALWPYNKLGTTSDMSFLFESLTNPQKTAITIARLRIMTQLRVGVRARDWEPEDIIGLERDATANPKNLPDLILYYRFLDDKEFSKAENLMDQAMEVMLGNERRVVFATVYCYEAAFIRAISGRIADAKRAFDMGTRASTSQSLHKKRAEAAILAAEGNREDAQKVAEAFRAQLEAEGDMTRPNFQAEADWIEWALDSEDLLKQ